ncbi:hypothetical protein MJO47_05345 [Desulfuromonas sp. KJ2020]|uniref:hypothetical protein n=1 Tax=Desulfuromonas sp. KJ2020 TaxID=2919173 RepID=UPI0020A74C0B|nr:hypothetical protein [Desulfuromonas sp. KJ2020]MCP3176521.1 hypothetical protein [Desulfuromonas sp. KJ2020]
MNSNNLANIEIFNRSVGILFGKLLETFPKRTEIIFNDLAIEMFDDDDNTETYFDKHELFAETTVWLERSGYIWASKIESYEAYGVVLTPMGLETMKHTPEALTGKSIGEEISSAIKSGVKETAKSALATIVSIALTEGYKVLSR